MTASRDCWIASFFCFLFMLFQSSSEMSRGLVLWANGLTLCSTGRGGSILVDEELGPPGFVRSTCLGSSLTVIVADSISSGVPNMSSRSSIKIFLAISRSFARAARSSLRAFSMAVSTWMRGTFSSFCSGKPIG